MGKNQVASKKQSATKKQEAAKKQDQVETVAALAEKGQVETKKPAKKLAKKQTSPKAQTETETVIPEKLPEVLAQGASAAEVVSQSAGKTVGPNLSEYVTESGGPLPEADEQPEAVSEVKITGADFHEIRMQFVDVVFNQYKKVTDDDQAGELYQKADDLLTKMKDMSEKAGRFGQWVAKATRNFENIDRNSTLVRMAREAAKVAAKAAKDTGKAPAPEASTETPEPKVAEA